MTQTSSINLKEIVTGQYVDLPRMLDARERRQHTQRQLIRAFGCPVISFTLNIVGPVKVFPLAVRAFEEGLRLIHTQCSAWRLPIKKETRIQDITGYEAFLSVDSDPKLIKEILCRLEERTILGRLFDLDVIRTDGAKVSRRELSMAPRKCLLCDQEAFVCGRSRTHPVDRLLERECQIMEEYFNLQYARHISSLSMAALLYEVAATPKPGLVDRDNQGAHRDMDFYTFQSSAVSLNQFFEEFTLLGIQNRFRPPEQVLALIRPVGIQAEEVMMAATGGVNTHKGMIFSLGIFCCVLGYLKGNQIPFSQEAFTETCRKMTCRVLEDFEGITPDNAKTPGERLYALHGITGIRGEASKGYPTVFQVALPAFRGYKSQGLSPNDAGILTLLHIIAGFEDTNIIARSDYETMTQIRCQIQELLDSGLEHRDYISIIRKLDQEFIQKNISPGGSADILALTYFMDSLFMSHMPEALEQQSCSSTFSIN